MSYDELELDRLGDEKSALFFLISDTDTTYNFLVALALESLFRHRPLRLKPEDEYTVYEVDDPDTDEEADLLNFDDLDSDEFV